MPDIEKIPWDELLDNKQTAYILGTTPHVISNYKDRKRIPKEPTLYQIIKYIIKGRKDSEEKLASLNRLEKYTFREFETIEEAKDYYTPIIVYLVRTRNPSSVGNQIFLTERLSNEEIAKIFKVKPETIKDYVTRKILERYRKDVAKRMFELEKTDDKILSMLNELYEHIEEFNDLGEARAVLTGVYNLELEEPRVTKEAETPPPTVKKKPEKKIHKKPVRKEIKPPKEETYLNEVIGVKEMLEMGFTNSEIVDAFRDDSGLKKKGDGKTTRRFLTPYIAMEYVTDDEYRRFKLISELYEKDLKEGLEEDEEVEEGIIVAIKFIKEKYNLDLPIPDELEEPEPETEPEKFELKDVREMLGNDVVFEHLLSYLGFKTDEGLVNRYGLEVYAVISNCDDWPLGERQEFLSEIGVEGSIIEIADKLGKTLYIPKPEEDENDIPEAGPEPDIYNLKQISETLEPDVFEDFKTMFGYKLGPDSFTLNNIAKFGVESEYDGFSLKERDDFLEDFGLEGGVEQVAETFGYKPYIPKETEKEEKKYTEEQSSKPIDVSWLKKPDTMVNVGEWFKTRCEKYGHDLNNEIGIALVDYCKKNEKFKSPDIAYMTREELYVFLASRFSQLEEMDDMFNLKMQF